MVCRLRHFSVISVLALTISNILLTIRLMHKTECQNPEGFAENSESIGSKTAVPAASLTSSIQTAPPPCIDYISVSQNNSNRLIFDNLNLNSGRWDNSRQYKYFDFAVIGDHFDALSKEYIVSLATQSSIERLHSLVHVSLHWNGPISAALYVAGNDELYLMQLYLTYLRNCFVSIREQVSFHLAIPKARPPTVVRQNLKTDSKHFVCDQPETTLKRLLKFRTPETVKWRIKNAYPQNHLRNLARKGCQTSNVFLTDIDIIPSINFTQHLDQFLRKSKCNKFCAYVIPTYEIDSRAKFPKDKLDLIRLSRKGLARPFHHKVFIYNQYATNFTRWEADGGLIAQDETVISYNVTNFEFLYEPFYVATDLVPPHDERFLGYGFTRNTQVYEMFVAGYQFLVLSPIFTCHWGLQNKKGRPSWRERQNNLNRKQFEVFKREVFARYHRDPLQMMQPKKKGLK